MTTAQEVVDSLPNTEEGVYRVLKDAGITGRRHSPCHCPIAELIRSRTGETWWVEVTQAWPTKSDARGNPYVEMGETRSIGLPMAVERFIRTFDATGAFIDLIAA